MKKYVLFMAFALLLSGCGAEETLETIADEWVAPVMAQPREVSAKLPSDALAPVLEGDGCRMYMGQGYEIVLETLSAGDLDATVRTLSGYSREAVTLVQTQWEEGVRYEFVWAAAGEGGGRLGRAAILDDGQYHYCLSALWEETMDSGTLWEDVFGSFRLA